MRSVLSFLAVAAAFVMAQPARADTLLWAQLAREDLIAARALIEANHPAAVEAHGDRAFLSALQRGYAAATDLAGQARTYAGYRAALTRFAASFGDGHIWSNPVLAANFAWPGFFVALSDGEWRVLVNGGDNLPPAGATLLSCDGRSAEALAAERLAPFVQGWEIPAQRNLRSIRLLVDRGETPQPRLEQCQFRAAGGETMSHRLEWRQISLQEYQRLTQAARPAADESLGLARWRDGWWIRLGSLGDDARELVEQVRQSRDRLIAAPYVVVDMRGNSGGASIYAETIAAILAGSARVAAVNEGHGNEGGSAWRASPGNLETVNRYLERFRDQPDFHRMLTAMKAEMERALAEGRPFAAVSEGEGGSTAPTFATPARPPRLILITDGRCFSSCLLAASLFRDLGATQVGQATNANTHYSEVREITLPSGLSTFSTLQAFIGSMPRQIGPFEPSVTLADAVVADDARVKEAVVAILR